MCCDAWGGYRNTPPTGPPTLGYTGHVYDPNAQLVYGKARWYAPELGTWMSEDPVGALANLTTPNGLNAWGYANGNPVRYTDPTGMEPEGVREEMAQDMALADQCAHGDQDACQAVRVGNAAQIGIAEGVAGIGVGGAICKWSKWACAAMGFAAGAGVLTSGGPTITAISEDATACALMFKGATDPDVVERCARFTTGTVGAGILGLAFRRPTILPIKKRLELVFAELLTQPRAKSAKEAMGQMNKTLTSVEDMFSGVPENPNPGLKPDGRMYPVQSDRTQVAPDGTITAESRRQITTYGPDGSITVRNKSDGAVIFQKPGGG